MPGSPSFLQRYRQLTFWNKVAFWGSVASLIGFPLSIISLLLGWLSLGGTASLAEFIQNPLALLCFASVLCPLIYLCFRIGRVAAFIVAGRSLPPEQQAVLVKAEYRDLQPDSLPPDIWHKAQRDNLIFKGSVCFLCLLLLAFIFYLAYQNLNAESRQEREQRNAELARLRSEIDKSYRETEESHARDRRRLVVAAEAHGQAQAIARFLPSDLTLQHARKLKELVQEFTEKVDQSQISPEDLSRIKLSEATVANIEHRYEDALNLVPNKLLQLEREKTDKQISREYEMMKVHAESYEGLCKWEKALASNQRLVVLKPEDYDARAGIARCHYYLGHTRDALAVWNELLHLLEKKFNHGDIKTGWQLAIGMINYAGVLAELGRPKEALAYATTAVNVQMLVMKRDKPLTHWVDLARTLLRRSDILADLGQYSNSLEDLDAADIAIVSMIKDGKIPETNNISASILSSRALVQLETGKAKEALVTIDKAIEMQTAIAMGRKEVVIIEQLAVSYDNRAMIRLGLGDENGAFTDFEKCIAIYDKLIADGHQEVSGRLATTLRKRGMVRADRLELIKAVDDLTKAEPIAKSFAKNQGTPAAEYDVAMIWSTLATIQRLAALRSESKKQRREFLDRAAHNQGEAAKLMAHLYSITGNEQYREDAIACLIKQTAALHELGNRQRAGEILKKVATALPPIEKILAASGSKDRLAIIKINVGMLESELGSSEKGIKLMNDGIQLHRERDADGSKRGRHQLAQSLQLRGRVYGNNKMKDLAIQDLDESITLFKQLIADGHRSVQEELNRSLRHRREAELGQPLRELP